MNHNYIMCFDLETSSASPTTTNILELGACVINPRTLTIQDQFQSLLKPLDFSTIEEEALKVNKITIESLEKAPATKVVWNKFVQWVHKYNNSPTNKSPYHAPIAAGYNIVNFDLPIIRRYAKMFGQWDEKREDQKLFNQVYHIDLQQNMWGWLENCKEPDNLKFTTLQTWLGINPEVINMGGHGAMYDSYICAMIIIRLLGWQRKISEKNLFHNSFKEVNLGTILPTIVRKNNNE